MAKGKEHKKYEFGTKASVAMTKTHEGRTSTTLTLCLKSLTSRGHLPTSGPDAPSWIALTAAENVLHRGSGARKSAQTPSLRAPRFTGDGQDPALKNFHEKTLNSWKTRLSPAALAEFIVYVLRKSAPSSARAQ